MATPTAPEPTTPDLRYPVGRLQYAPDQVTAADRDAWRDDVAALPQRLRAAVAGLSDAQLDTPYRPGGWTVRQLVHHVADSHVNAYTRFRLALTEDAPTIKPYHEAAWAELPDARTLPVEVSLRLLDALHERWTALLDALEPGQRARTVVHPEHERPMSMDHLLAMYAWHSRHHVAHVTALREREGW